MKLKRHKIQAPIILSLDSTGIKLICRIAKRISKLLLLMHYRGQVTIHRPSPVYR